MHLGLTTEEFYGLTLRKYYLLLSEHRKKIHHAEWIAALTLSTLVNSSMRPPEEPRMPSHWAWALPTLEVRESRKKIDRQAVANRIRANFDRAIAQQKARRNFPEPRLPPP